MAEVKVTLKDVKGDTLVTTVSQGPFFICPGSSGPL